jgi:hypothetical protein
MSLSDAQLDDFAAYARRPETWLSGSHRHFAVFEVLTDRLDELRMQSGRSQDEFSGCFYAAYLHAGLAVENAVKAFLVARDPTIVSDGTIDRKKLGARSGHAFVELAQQMLGPLSNEERNVLFKLEEHVVWAGKYTVPMRADILYDQESLQVLRTAPMNERALISSIVRRLQGHAHAP